MGSIAEYFLLKSNVIIWKGNRVTLTNSIDAILKKFWLMEHVTFKWIKYL
jgi:hypothetical protein